MYDELDLDMLGDERTALFLIMSDTDGTFAFLISLIYSILFNRLCERADDVSRFMCGASLTRRPISARSPTWSG